MKKLLDFGNFITIALTILLFVISLFFKGITKDILLEAGILLVSIKLILFNYKQSQLNREIINKLEDIQKSLSEIKK